MSASGLVGGRLALVTGASSGIGRETCRVLAREGAAVVVTCIDEAGAQETVKLMEGPNHIALRYDVTDFESAKGLLKSVIEKYGKPPTILVNCAGIVVPKGVLEETPESFQRMLDINLKGTFFTSQALCQELVTAKTPGSVVNVSSRAVDVTVDSNSAYTASKCGVDAITKCFAKDLGSHGIRVNSVQPGLIDTPMIADATPEAVQDWLNKSTKKRRGQPQEVAEVITFLASDRASYINGAHIAVSDGF